MQQFRVVILDEEDNIKSVEYESVIFQSGNKWDKAFSDAQYKELLELNSKYDLCDFENVPYMEFQRRETNKNGEWGEWKYLSNPIEDYYNL